MDPILFITVMITDRNGRNDVPLQIYYKITIPKMKAVCQVLLKIYRNIRDISFFTRRGCKICGGITIFSFFFFAALRGDHMFPLVTKSYKRVCTTQFSK